MKKQQYVADTCSFSEQENISVGGRSVGCDGRESDLKYDDAVFLRDERRMDVDWMWAKVLFVTKLPAGDSRNLSRNDSV